ncbi:MAG: Smr/MutS family protein [Bacteroidia bacterium]|jgi:hypothetical protein
MNGKFLIGDLVRPLNETGEGTVSGFRKDGTILVTLQDGFEIPFLQNQIVLIKRNQEEKVSSASTVSTRLQSLPDESLFLLISSEAPVKNEPQLALHLANAFKFPVFAAIYGIEGKNHRLIATSATVEQHVAKLISISVKDLLAFDRLYIQVLFTPSGSEKIPDPQTAVIRHQVPALADPAGWPVLEAIASRGLQFRICGAQSTNEDVKKSESSPKSQIVEREAFVLSERDGFHEIDLHIEELLDDTAGMDNSAIIRHQMRVFEQCIDEARVRKLWKFVAIHGVGKGVLREAVRQCIKDEGLHYQDASYQRYGYGATEVLMK